MTAFPPHALYESCFISAHSHPPRQIKNRLQRANPNSSRTAEAGWGRGSSPRPPPQPPMAHTAISAHPPPLQVAQLVPPHHPVPAARVDLLLPRSHLKNRGGGGGKRQSANKAGRGHSAPRAVGVGESRESQQLRPRCKVICTQEADVPSAAFSLKIDFFHPSVPPGRNAPLSLCYPAAH